MLTPAEQQRIYDRAIEQGRAGRARSPRFLTKLLGWILHGIGFGLIVAALASLGYWILTGGTS